MMKFMEFKKM